MTFALCTLQTHVIFPKRKYWNKVGPVDDVRNIEVESKSAYPCCMATLINPTLEVVSIIDSLFDGWSLPVL